MHPDEPDERPVQAGRPRVEIYTKDYCGFCRRAKALLRDRGVEFHEIDVSWEPVTEGQMIERAGGAYTVPQVFIDGRHIGGGDELTALDATGELDRLLRKPAPAGES